MVWSWIRILLFLALVLAILAAAYAVVEHQRQITFEAGVSDLSTKFSKVREGMTKQQVLDVFATPPDGVGISQSTAHTREYLFWSVPRNDGRAPPTVIITVRDGEVEKTEKRDF